MEEEVVATVVAVDVVVGVDEVVLGDAVVVVGEVEEDITWASYQISNSYSS
jgi:hypothetical protein